MTRDLNKVTQTTATAIAKYEDQLGEKYTNLSRNLRRNTELNAHEKKLFKAVDRNLQMKKTIRKTKINNVFETLGNDKEAVFKNFRPPPAAPTQNQTSTTKTTINYNNPDPTASKLSFPGTPYKFQEWSKIMKRWL